MVERGKIPGLLASGPQPQAQALYICRAGCKGCCTGETQMSPWPDRSCRHPGRQNCPCEVMALLSLSPHLSLQTFPGSTPCKNTGSSPATGPPIWGSPCCLTLKLLKHFLMAHDPGQTMLPGHLGLSTSCPSARGFLSHMSAWPPSPLSGVTSPERPSLATLVVTSLTLPHVPP